MLMVRVNVGKDKEGKLLEPIVGLLIDTHLMQTQGPLKATIGEGGKLMQAPGQAGLQAFGVVAAGEGFIVGPLASMTPIMQPDEESDDEPPEAEPDNLEVPS